jgi:hypothetical protein
MTVDKLKPRTVPVAALVLIPDEIFEYYSIFNALHIRHGRSVPFEMFPLDENQVQRYFNKYPPEARSLLGRFTDADIAFEISQLKKKHGKEKSGIPLERFLDRSVVRYLYELTIRLLEAAPDITIYHRIRNAQTGNYMIARCKLHTQPPELSFEVTKTEQGKLSVRGMLHIAGETQELGKFQQYKFLLRHEHQYYLLRPADYLTLEWLAQSKPEQFELDPVLFSQRIVQKLEETHKVAKNNIFDLTEIRCSPSNCIYFSEISDSMLMLTPRWRYDGLLVEGPFKEIHDTIRNGIAYRIYRDKAAEEEFIQYLQSLHPGFGKQSGKFFYLTFSEAGKKQWFLKAYHQLLELDTEIIGLEMLRHFRYSPFSPETNVQLLDKPGERARLKLEIAFGKEKIALNELQKVLLSGQNSILLKDNAIGVFPEEWLAAYAPLIKHGKITGKEIEIPQWIFLSLEKGTLQETLAPVVPAEWERKWMTWQDEQSILYPLPAALNAKLRPYQHKGFEWMALLSEIGAGACLADDMGLGKTLQTITFLCWRLQHNTQARFLICCPASLIYNWESELKKFAPSLSVYIHNGLKRNPEHFINGNHQVLICSYGTLRSDVDLLSVIGWDSLVLDESHNVKNLQARTTQAAARIKASCKIALSGTPVMNNTLDLYAQLNILLPGLFGGLEFFRREYAYPIDRDNDAVKIKALQKMIAPFVLRRTKKQVAGDLPEKTETVLWCNMGEQQRQLYEEIRTQIKDSIFLGIKSEGLEKNKLNILQGILKLRQVCGSPRLIPEGKTCSEAIKLELLLHELANLKESKALVFSQFKGMLHLIAEECTRRGIPFYHFDGDTAIRDRQEMVQKFQSENNDVGVFLISLKSGNAGLNLTAAEYVFLVDPWWNTAVQQQAIDRTHRIGQQKNVFAYQMLCKDTIEEKIRALQQKKQFLSEELVGAEDGFVKQLTEEDVAFLFS